MNDDLSLAPLVLYIEDDKSMAHILGECLREVDPTLELVRANDAEQGLEYLKQRVFSHVRLPSAVIIDLYLPRKDGFAVVVELRSDAVFADFNLPILDMRQFLP